jgi:betaine-homocysteine S-methyltransferase
MTELLERLEHGSVICAEGYLFELERRGYLQAGGFVPEVVLENPDKVAELHREFVHAGSDGSRRSPTTPTGRSCG